jgi:predicted MPP superfamily phosphohydrolase
VTPILLGLLGVGILVVAYAVFVERRWYRLKRYRLAILPAGGPAGLTVLHLSDLHLGRGHGKMRRFLASLPPAEVTVITGDIVGEPEAVESVVEALRPVRGRLASLFVLGSNDLWAPQPVNYLRYFFPRRRHARVPKRKGRAGDLVRLLQADGWSHLRNGKHTLDGLPIEVVGLDDPHIHRSDLRVAPRSDGDTLGLAVVHSPDPGPELVALGYDLVVSGHTHGGQVNVPFFGALVSNCSIPPRMARGLFRLGHGFLHVSPGLGTGKFAPFRLFCPPEATLLELHARR